MSRRELRRLRVLTVVLEGMVSIEEAATSLGLSSRQVRRLLSRRQRRQAAPGVPRAQQPQSKPWKSPQQTSISSSSGSRGVRYH
jgi:transposase